MHPTSDAECRDAIRRTIEYLAGVCDHAQQRDDIGFSANTAPVGHELAHLPDRFWNDGTYVVAARISYHHRAQALQAGVIEEGIVPFLQSAAGGPRSDDDVRTGWIVIDRTRQGVVLSVATGMNDLVKLLKRLPISSQPAGRGRVWAVPAEECFALEPFAGRFELEPGVQDIIIASRRHASEDSILALADRSVVAEEGMFKLTFSFNADLVSSIKALSSRRRWNGTHWLLQPDAASADLVKRLTSIAGFAISTSARALMENPPPAPAQQPAAEKPHVRKGLVIAEAGDDVDLRFSFNQEWVDAVKTLHKNDRRFDRNIGPRWLIERHAVRDLVEAFEACPNPPPAEDLEALLELAPAAPTP